MPTLSGRLAAPAAAFSVALILLAVSVASHPGSPSSGADGALETRPGSATTSSSPALPTPSNTVAAVPTTDPTPEQYAGDWDVPLRDALRTTLVKAPLDGQLAFTPIVPLLGTPPDIVVITDPSIVTEPDRTVAYVMHFPLGTDFPRNGTLTVMEALAQDPSVDLQQIAERDNAQAGGGFTFLRVAGYPAILIEGNGTSRIHTIVNKIAIDVEGPDVTAAVNEMLTSQLLAPVAARK